MRRTFLILSVAMPAVVVTAVGGAQTPTEKPFPSPTVVQYFVSARTLDSTGALTNFFKQGSTITFQGFAVETKTGNIASPDSLKYFNVMVPGQKAIKLAYKAPAAKKPPVPWRWTATWTVPADFPLGLVPVKVNMKSKTNGYGSFVQIPVATSQLTVTKG